MSNRPRVDDRAMPRHTNRSDSIDTEKPPKSDISSITNTNAEINMAEGTRPKLVECLPTEAVLVPVHSHPPIERGTQTLNEKSDDVELGTAETQLEKEGDGQAIDGEDEAEPHEYPDGGYGWVVLLCCVTLAGTTMGWGMAWSVFQNVSVSPLRISSPHILTRLGSITSPTSLPAPIPGR